MSAKNYIFLTHPPSPFADVIYEWSLGWNILSRPNNVTVVKNNFIWRGKLVKIPIPPKSRFLQEILKKSRNPWSPILVFNCPVYRAHLRSTISELNDACTSPEKSRMNTYFLSYFKAACQDANWPLSGHSEGNLTSLIVT